jgi:hypothetical protein
MRVRNSAAPTVAARRWHGRCHADATTVRRRCERSGTRRRRHLSALRGRLSRGIIKIKCAVRRCEYSIDGIKLHYNFVWTPIRGAVTLHVVVMPEGLEFKECDGRATSTTAAATAATAAAATTTTAATAATATATAATITATVVGECTLHVPASDAVKAPRRRGHCQGPCAYRDDEHRCGSPSVRDRWRCPFCRLV